MRYILFAALCLCACDDSTNSNTDSNTATGGTPGKPGLDRGGIDLTMGGNESDPIPTIGQGGQPAAGGDTPLCMPNQTLQCLTVETLAVCNADGSGIVQMPCPDGSMCQDGECVVTMPQDMGGRTSEPDAPRPPSGGNCQNGQRVCIDDNRTGVCREGSDVYEDVERCPAGASCSQGVCVSDCQVGRKVRSYVGCEYWSVDLDNYPDPFGDPASVPHAVAISNTSDEVARIRIEGPQGVDLDAPEFEIPPNDLAVYTFPRLDIDGTGIFDRAFRIVSDWPVVVYQFNPLNNENVASNDASLLLPAEGLGNEYIALSWPTSPMPCIGGMNCLPHQHGYVTVIATSPGQTQVRVTPAGRVAAGGLIEELPKGVERVFELTQGQVLNLQADAVDLESFEDIINGFMPLEVEDMSGTVIVADKAIAVFGGHEEAVIGRPGDSPGDMSTCCAEHLEQQLLPVSTWGNRYLAARSEPRGGSKEHWRVVAATDGTMVTTVPPQPDSAQFMLNRGEFKEIISENSFEIVASEPVMVAQYLVSQSRSEANVGDPAMIIAPPVSQLRNAYQIITPMDYTSNWLTIARPIGVIVTLDDAPIDDALFNPFGGGEYEVGFVPVEEGVHRLGSQMPFSLSVYGYSAAVSYGYPGGLNLRSDADMP